MLGVDLQTSVEPARRPLYGVQSEGLVQRAVPLLAQPYAIVTDRE
jgi:hypothetical protein